MIKTMTVLGSTGSIGVQALDVARLTGIEITALTSNVRIDILENQIREFRPAFAAVADEEKAEELKIRVGLFFNGVQCFRHIQPYCINRER